MHVGIAAAEGAVGLGEVEGAAGGVDVAVEAVSDGGIEGIAGVPEGAEAVGVEDLAPEIGVVTGGIAIAREEVEEMRAGVAERDLRALDAC